MADTPMPPPQTFPLNLLEVRDIVSGYGRVPVLQGLTLAVPEGLSLGLIGPNGHGKTTLFRTISGLNRVWSGEIRFAGQPITNRPAPEIRRRGLLHAPQGNRLFPEMTVRENLELGAYAPAARPHLNRRLAEVVAIFSRLGERMSQRARTLSGGERQMVSVGCGPMAGQRLLILDEPTLGLSPKLKIELQAAIGRIRDSGLQLLIVEQDPDFLRAPTNRQVFVQAGRARLMEAAEGLNQDEIMEMYLGVH